MCFVFSDNFISPRNHSVTLSIGGLHRNPEYFLNPLGYNPDRFLAENIKARHADESIPFSAGKRNCIGKTPYEKIYIITMLDKVDE